VYAAVLVLAFFGIVEAVLRWVDPKPPVRAKLILRAVDVDIEFPFMREDPELFWSPRPGFRGRFQDKAVHINSLGLRGPDVRVPKPAGRRRLLCFGDSITFGYGMADGETYPARLAENLAARGVEVLNAGVTGYTSWQVLGRLRRIAPVVGADFASFCVGWNDGTRRPVEDRVYASRLAAARGFEGALRHWRLYRLLSALYVRGRMNAEREAKVRDHPRVPLEQYRENLEAIVAECRARGIRPVFVRLPHRRLPGEPAPSPAYEEALLDVARRRGIPALSAGELGLDGRSPDTGRLFIDSLHLSVEGNELMATLLARQLDELGLI
jgi:lysophospholipase L1-like esterase